MIIIIAVRVGTQLRRCDDIIWFWIQTEISSQSESVLELLLSSENNFSLHVYFV